MSSGLKDDEALEIASDVLRGLFCSNIRYEVFDYSLFCLFYSFIFGNTFSSHGYGTIISWEQFQIEA